MQKYAKLMEHVGDWLYYVIFFGIAIVSLINSVAKKKSTDTVSPPPVYESPPPPPPLSVKRKTPPPAPNRSRFSGGYETLFQNEGQRVFENETPTDNEVTATDNWSLNDVETIRKAIVYTEILNRKY